MVNILAALELVSAASVLEGKPSSLWSDATTLFTAYETVKGGSVAKLAHDPNLKGIIGAAASVLQVSNQLAQDPHQFKNIQDLLASL